MARILQIRFAGESERVLNELCESGIAERDIIARALWLLKVVKRTGRVALLRAEALTYKEFERYIDHVFVVDDSDAEIKLMHLLKLKSQTTSAQDSDLRGPSAEG